MLRPPTKGLGKRPWRLIDPFRASIEVVVDVLSEGANKYAPNDWMNKDPGLFREALERHWYAYAQGEVSDPETGKHHLAHLVCSALILMWFDAQGDRHDRRRDT